MVFPAHRLEFTHRSLSETKSLRCVAQSQFARKGHRVTPWRSWNFVGIRPITHPAEPESSTVTRGNVGPRNGRVEIRAIVSPQRAVGGGFRGFVGIRFRLLRSGVEDETCAVKVADEILATGTAGRRSGSVHDEHPLFLAFASNDERKQIGTFPDRFAGASGPEIAEVSPLLQIL